MKKWNVHVDFRSENVRIGAIIIPAMIQKKKKEEEELVSLVKGVVIPPHRSAWVEIRTPTRLQEGIRFVNTPLDIRLRRKVQIQDGIIKQGGTASILLVNEAPHQISLFKGTKVRTIDDDEETVRWIQAMDKGQEQIRKITSKGKEPYEELEKYILPENQDKAESTSISVESPPIPTEDYSELLKQIEEMNYAESSDLTLEEQAQLKDFLKKNVDIFAKNPKNPGQIPSVQHSINTGDHPPIKLRPKRVSPAEEEAIRKEIQMMREAT